MKLKFAGSALPPGITAQDRAMAEALNHINHPTKAAAPLIEKDPMQVFRQQMAYMDSIRKSEDPAYLAQQKELAKAKAVDATPAEKPLSVNLPWPYKSAKDRAIAESISGIFRISAKKSSKISFPDLTGFAITLFKIGPIDFKMGINCVIQDFKSCFIIAYWIDTEVFYKI
jgi:hypothetical protein